MEIYFDTMTFECIFVTYCKFLGVPQAAVIACRWSSGKPKESDEAFDARWEAYFQRYVDTLHVCI